MEQCKKSHKSRFELPSIRHLDKFQKVQTIRFEFQIQAWKSSDKLAQESSNLDSDLNLAKRRKFWKVQFWLEF
jgi:hypothetical protein